MDKNILLLIEMFPDMDPEFLEFIYNDNKKNYLNVTDLNNILPGIDNNINNNDNFDNIM